MTKTVLIIDDVGFDRIIIGALMKQCGLQIIGEASNGIEGIKKALDLKPDIISLDKRMPDMDGMQVLEKLRSENYTKEIIFVSGDDLKDDKETFQKNGITGIFKKPISKNELMEFLKTLD